MSRFTLEGGAYPVWTPDGRRITFASRKSGAFNIYSKLLDGSGAEEPLATDEETKYPFSWSPDGHTLAFVHLSAKTKQDLWMITPENKDQGRPFLDTPFREGAPAFSRDGRWLAYVTDESGRPEVCVRPVSGPGEKWTISAGGGIEPMWSRNGRQLFYRAGEAVFMVDVETSPKFSAGKPIKLFEKRYEPSNAFWSNYDVADDGRLLMVKADDGSAVRAPINVVLNWTEELKARLPPK